MDADNQCCRGEDGKQTFDDVSPVILNSQPGS
jgi:hypothetical protein